MWSFRFKHFIGHYRCSLRIESWIMVLIHEPEIGLKHYFLKLNILTTAQPLNTETLTLIQPLAIPDYRSVLNIFFGRPVASFPIHSSLKRPNNEKQKKKRGQLIPCQCRLSFSVLSLLKCCQSAHISRARRANRINPGLTPQARVQGNGLC